MHGPKNKKVIFFSLYQQIVWEFSFVDLLYSPNPSFLGPSSAIQIEGSDPNWKFFNTVLITVPSILLEH